MGLRLGLRQEALRNNIADWSFPKQIYKNSDFPSLRSCCLKIRLRLYQSCLSFSSLTPCQTSKSSQSCVITHASGKHQPPATAFMVYSCHEPYRQHGSTTSPHLASRLLRRIYVKPHRKHTVQTSSAALLVYWPSWLIVSVLLLAAGHKRCLSLRLWGFSVTAVVPLLSKCIFGCVQCKSNPKRSFCWVVICTALLNSVENAAGDKWLCCKYLAKENLQKQQQLK